jgi:hypothetical protein
MLYRGNAVAACGAGRALTCRGGATSARSIGGAGVTAGRSKGRPYKFVATLQDISPSGAASDVATLIEQTNHVKQLLFTERGRFLPAIAARHSRAQRASRVCPST